MQTPLRVLIVEDRPSDAELMVEALRQAGFQPAHGVVDTETDYVGQLDPALDVILADYSLPQFDALRALSRLKESGLDTPLIVVSGTIGDESAVECVRKGAADYVLKDRLSQLGLAVARAMAEKRLRDDKLAAERKLRRSEEMYRTLVESMDDVVVVKDAQGRYLAANRALAQMLGIGPEDLVGRTVKDIYPPAAARQIMDDDLQALRAVVTVESEFDIPTFDGPRTLHRRTAPLRDDTGRVVGVVAVSRDITERKRSEEALRASFEKLRETLLGTIRAMAGAVEMRDPYTAGHQRRVSELAAAIAREMGFVSEERITGIRLAGLIHDVGKLSVPAEILTKPGRLSEWEFSLIKVHPQTGYDLLKTVDFPWPIAETVLQHHEVLDGSGYPQGLSMWEILPEARVLAVADVVEAMASHRPYRPALGLDRALDEVQQGRGTRYDPNAVDACLRLFMEQGFVLHQQDEPDIR